jgi:hypothetical protein
VWHLCGLMIRQSLELGLHRNLRTDGKATHSDELKKRLFWSIYSLERRIALVLGRPLSISDDEIDIGFPQYDEDDIDHSHDMPGSGPGYQTSTQSPGEISELAATIAQANITFHVFNLMIDQLNAKSRFVLCRLAKIPPGPKVEKKISKRFRKLEDWKTAIFGSNSNGESPEDSNRLMWLTSRTPVQTPTSRPELAESQRVALLLNYHRARRLLLQAILTDVPRPNQPFPYASFAKSSGEVCQLNRRLHRLKHVPFTLLDLHSVFVAGFSMIYCAWNDPQLYDAEMAADFGACSTVLYLIAEQWGAGAKKYRDAFELVAEKTAEHVLDSRKSAEGGQPRRSALSHQYGQPGPAESTKERGLPYEMNRQSNSYDMGRDSNEAWTTETFDVWQMITQSVHADDFSLACDSSDFAGIEEFLVQEGLSWFNGSVAVDPYLDGRQ